MKNFKLIFLLSFTFLSILGTTSFATVNINLQTAEYILEYFGENLNFTSTYGNYDHESIKQTAQNILKNTSSESFKQFFNDNFIETIGYSGEYSWENVNVIGYFDCVNQIPKLDFILSNNTYSSELNYINMSYWNTSASNQNTTIEGTTNGTDTVNPLYKITITIYENNVFQITNSNVNNYYKYYDKIKDAFIIDEDNKTLDTTLILGMAPYQVVYFKQNSNNASNSYFLKNYFIAKPNDDPIPGVSGDTGSGDTGESGDTGGETTTPSGDTTNDKLDNIQGSLDNIKDKIPTSGEIAGATQQGNQDFWGNKDEMNEEDYETQINDGINNSMQEISGDLAKNEVFNSIAIAEQKIIDLFLEEPEDFKISWKDVKYLEKTIVPAGEINFSEICRENETLGRVKDIVNIIVSAMISLALFKQIFNLIMVTLGIDHPLILEPQDDNITEISRTKIGNKTYVTKRTYKSDKKGGR